MLPFTTVLLTFLLMMGGFATDLAYQAAARAELQRTLDAAALAAAGTLGFDSTAFDAMRDAAHHYGTLNPFRHPVDGTVVLDRNAGNTATGQIVVGTWTNGAFTPWDSAANPSGDRVNAVHCRWSGSVPTSFLRLLGVTTLPLSAEAVGFSNPPADMGCGEPFLPVAVTQCGFSDPSTGGFTSGGCGAALTFIRSSTQCDNSPGSPHACNTATWVSLDGSNPNSSYLASAIDAAGSPDGACGTFLRSGDMTGTNNGMLDSVFRRLADTFLARRVSTLAEDVCPANGCASGTPPTYPRGNGGWEAVVPMIETACPPGPMSGQHRILTFGRFVVTQVFYKNDGCVVWPNPDPQAQAYCANPDGSRRRDNDLRAVFGYFRCGQRVGETAGQGELPRVALARHVRLVK